MKHPLYFGLLLAAIALCLFSCAPTEEVVLGVSEQPAKTSQVREYNIQGVKVLYKPTTNEVVSAKLYIKGGMANYSQDQEGIEALMLNTISNAGTQDLDKDAFQSTLDRLGSSISGNAGYDYSTLSLRCVRRNFEESWKLFSSAILNPAFEKNEFERIKERMINAAKTAQVDPDDYLRKSSMRYTFRGAPYANNENGTPESLVALELQDVIAYYKKVIHRNQVSIIILGKLSEEEIKQKITSLINQLPFGTYSPYQHKPLNITSSSLNAIERDIKTNYLRGYMNAPAYGSDEEMSMRIAMNILRKRLWKEIRSERSLSYAPSAFFPSSITGATYAAVYVSTDDPNACARIIVDEIRKIKSEGFTEVELKGTKGQFSTFHYLRNETNDSQAEGLATAESGQGWQLSERFIERVEDVSLEKLNQVFAKYAKAIEWTYLGDTKILDQSIYEEEL